MKSGEKMVVTSCIILDSLNISVRGDVKSAGKIHG